VNNAMAKSEQPQDRGDTTEVSFRVGADRVWCTPADLVPATHAREFVREWLRTGRRPTNVLWAEL